MPHALAAMAVAVATLAMGCGEPVGPRVGSLVITVATPGPDTNWDLDGYLLSIDGGVAQTLASNETLRIPDLEIGDHQILLDGLAPNCSFAGQNPLTVRIAANEVFVSFVVNCGAKIGTVRVTTTTSGSDPDTDGYSLVVGSRVTGGVPANGSFDMTGILEGDHSVRLSGVSDNCAVEAPHPRTVTVANGGVVTVPFQISCVPGAALRVTTTTSGVDPDVTGYHLSVSQNGRPVSSTPAPANGTVMIGGLQTGTYTVQINDMAANCDVVPSNGRDAAVTAGSITDFAVDISCAVPGRLAYVESFGTLSDLYLVNTNGNAVVRLTSEGGPDLDPAWSPDGSRIAFTTGRHGSLEIYVMDATGANPVRLTNGGGNDQPTWSPDGSKIAFVNHASGKAEIHVMNANGTGVVRLTNNDEFDGQPAWSPDGSKIAFASDRGGIPGIWVMNADGSSPTRLTSNDRNDFHPAWSPDGTRIAYSSGVFSYTRDIWVMNADGTGRVALTNGYEDALDPAWSPAGDKIAFTSNTYYYSSHIVIVGLDGIPYAPVREGSGATNPSWRP